MTWTRLVLFFLRARSRDRFARAEGFFDAEFYIDAYPDVSLRGLTPFEHYVLKGWQEGRNPNRAFDTKFYLENYDDVRKAGVCPLLHYANYGVKEGRVIGDVERSSREYLGQVDVIAAGVVRGWVKDASSSDPLTVQLVIDGHVVAECVANEFREDLASAQIGTGRYGFGLRIPVLFADGEEHEFYVGLKGEEMAVRTELPPVFVLPAAAGPQVEKEGPVAAPAIRVAPKLSVIMPTFNRGATMESTVGQFAACTTKVDGEIIIVDDGSTDDTPDRLKNIAARASNVITERVPNGGPGAARNVGASLARGDILVFVGDDVSPVDTDFLLLHSAAHHRYRKRGEAVLGKICWPNMNQLDVNFVMRHIQGEGEEQFGYRNMTPYHWYSWPLFYSSNVSVKRNIVAD